MALLIVGILLVLVGGALIVVAVLGGRSRLPRNRWFGVRTEASLQSDAAFALANRAAAAPTGAAGVVGVIGGAALLAGAPGLLSAIVIAVSVVGVLVIAGFAGVVGNRAAAAVPTLPAPVACAGVCAGCELVASCRPSTAEPTNAGS
ncbi:SdpI family protein [Pseudonocardia sp. GCM10023141]|uniref:SdpI family protein n=1 Tax=Pseudonocardia sp. GCM10023141 TaxID=3252653 RepID=UPI0036131EA2